MDASVLLQGEKKRQKWVQSPPITLDSARKQAGTLAFSPTEKPKFFNEFKRAPKLPVHQIARQNINTSSQKKVQIETVKKILPSYQQQAGRTPNYQNSKHNKWTQPSLPSVRGPSETNCYSPQVNQNTKHEILERRRLALRGSLSKKLSPETPGGNQPEDMMARTSRVKVSTQLERQRPISKTKHKSGH